jgi:hypothetical protein
VVPNYHTAKREPAGAWRCARAGEGLEIDTIAGDVSWFGANIPVNGGLVMH